MHSLLNLPFYNFLIMFSAIKANFLQYVWFSYWLSNLSAPAIFTVAFNILKKFLSAETVGSVKIMNTDRKKWEKAILENIDPEMLPKW